MAEKAAAEGDAAASSQYYQAALAADPDDLEALVGYAALLEKGTNGWARAELLLKRACAAHPDAVHPYAALVRLYRAAGRSAEADALYKGLRTRSPDHPHVQALAEKPNRTTGNLLEKLRKLRAFGEGATRQDLPTPPRRRPEGPPVSRTTGEPGSRCKYCGEWRIPGAHICRRCGAAL
jgi:tetratricopeptide (TPR) repeat protein